MGVGRTRTSRASPRLPRHPGDRGDQDRDGVWHFVSVWGSRNVSRNVWALSPGARTWTERCVQAQMLQTHLAELQEAMERGRNIREAG